MADGTRYFVGTSGFSYDEWRGAFYPEGLKKAAMLSFYGERLPAVELNNTFYRMPRERNCAAWADQVPAAFRFAIKAPRGITWSRKLVDCADLIDELFRALRPLGERLGCVFYLVPKFVTRDDDVLRAFLASLPRDARAAFEFADASWHDPAVCELLHAHGATVVASDRDDEPPPELAADAAWLYLRLRRSTYGDDELRAWRERMAAVGVDDAFVFFKHEDSCAGPALAERFLGV